MAIGRLLGEGRTAEVFEYGAGKAIKVLRPGFSPDLISEELELTTLASTAGAPTPSIHGTISLQGRAGLIMGRVNGGSLLDVLRGDLDGWTEWAEVLARTHADVLQREVKAMPDVRARIRASVNAAPLSAVQHHAAMAALDSLGGGRQLLHGDLHPSNVFLEEPGVTVIDWGNASQGAAAADIARTLRLIAPESIRPDLAARDDILERLDSFREAYLKGVLGLTDATEEEVDRWVLPVLAARLSRHRVGAGDDLASHRLDADVTTLSRDGQSERPRRRVEELFGGPGHGMVP